jgi:predicted ribosome quality control (RQC) complex YloA/Tae2 family protein
VYFDALTVAAVADELRATVVGGRVQRIVEVDPLSLGLEIFAGGTRHYLLLSADPRYPRVYLTDHKLRRGAETSSPVLLLARKYIHMGRLVAVDQPPFERVLSLRFSGPEGECELLAELMERRANIILAQDGFVLDAVQRVSAEMNRYRTVMPNRPYVPPPPQAKLDPTDVTEYQLRRILAEAPAREPLWRALVARVTGVSPILGREIAFRATGDAGATASSCSCISPLLDAFELALIPYWEHRWQPTVQVDPTGSVTAFAPYPLTHMPSAETTPTISQALVRFYRPLLDGDAYGTAKAPLQAVIRQARSRVLGRRDALTGQLPPAIDLERMRQMGELILAYASTIVRGQSEFRAQYAEEDESLTIPLNPALSPIANAQHYFREYEKGKRATAGIPQLLAEAELELAYLDQLATDLTLSNAWPEIDEVAAALESAGYPATKPLGRPRGTAPGPLRVVSADGLVILVGRNSRQNNTVTRHRAGPHDLWLHAHGVPGGHVVIKNGGQPVPDGTLRQAAQLAAWYSAAREEAEVQVDYIERRHVRRPKSARALPGLVIYDGAKTVRVRPRASHNTAR